ncbi:epoxide hydrolase 1 [Metarhizium album ARSEF 1941]|uniref:Epoxide hydrolase 1 n=1 Tax=Metarhizium album (strain ARSEF 1941) TaxID=1081103 RepID=A0A0B2WKG4_METAS|nr:epoxide hydrolase 1 [Metarhizium album ARSEF 1941]KHN94418.1 epoxide hydrolase 1 [Metarhizium album ARSEF 1941]
MAPEIKPFEIAVPDSALAALQAKLATATLPDKVDFSDDWSYGAARDDVGRLARRWRDTFDWRAQEQRLNRLPHYTTKIAVDGFHELDIHFVHQRSARPDAIPLLFVHGYPQHGQSFHVVAPSLPNFGFSQQVRQPGFALDQYAECMHKVMVRLGYARYVTQGGDWGFFITRLIGLRYPAHCLASHVNFPCVRPPGLKSLWFGLRWLLGRHSRTERQGLARTLWYLAEGSGYMVQQSTKPSTLGFALADSPVALLAWIYEKLHDWTDGYAWTDDEVLTWVSVYHFSAPGPAASLRIYYEANRARAASFRGTRYVPSVPLGISYYPRDLFAVPRPWARCLGPVVYEATHTHGGHFAAFEEPELFAADLRAMFGPGGGAHGVVARLALDC